MTRKIVALLLSTTFALAACQANNSADNNTMAADDLNAMTANDMSGAADMNATASVTLSSPDQQFVSDSIKGDTAEIAIAQLAQQKGASQGVKDFGKTLENDHGAHKQKLIDLANSAGVTVPIEPSDTGQQQLDKLQTLSGSDFDRTFVQMMIGNHQKGIAKNETEAKGTGPAAELAQQTVPTLKKHLSIAQSLQK